MDTINRLKKHYRNQEPTLSFGGSEGVSLTTTVYPTWPEEKATEHLGVPVWHGHIKSVPDTPKSAGYCVVDACLDPSGHLNPAAIPLPSQMQGHELRVVIYVDSFDFIKMRVIGGFTDHPGE